MLKVALWYRNKMNFSIIPIRNDGSKKPHIKWSEWQSNIASEAQIKTWWQKWPNASIGIVTGSLSNLTVLDFDWHKMTQEQIKEVDKKFPSVATPTATSPNGGEHRYFLYNEDLPNKSDIIPNVDGRNDGGYIIAPPSQNGVGSYQWSEKAKMGEMALRSVPTPYLDIINAFSIEGVDKIGSPSQFAVKGNISFQKGSRDQTLFHIANHLVRGGMKTEEIQYLLTLIADRLCDPPYPQKDIIVKIQSALKRAQDKDVNVSELVREFILSTKDNIEATGSRFRTSDIYETTDLSTSVHRKSVHTALIRCVEQGLIVRDGDTRGHYRVVSEEDAIDIGDVIEGELINVGLPFGMERYVDIMPKDLIVYAGVPNAGKTALMLETIRLNMRQNKCWYFSSEMGKEACKRRLSKYDGDVKWQFKIQDSFNSYLDIIKPNDFNFIDYIEVIEGEFFKIPSILGQIQRKLKKGLAFVALQKNSGTEYGVGGEQTKAKPSLFVGIENDYPYNVLKIIKAKNFKDENPNGYIRKFKIVGGINLLPYGVWEPEI